MASLSKEQKKEMIQAEEKKRADHPQAKPTESGFAKIEKDAEKLESEN